MKAKEFIPASKPRNFVAKNQQTAGAGAHKDKKKAEKQGDVKHKKNLMPMEDAKFGSYYYEKLAQKVFDENPSLDTSGRAEEVMNAGYKIAIVDLGKKQAQGLFGYDEDFPGDFVSAYSYLQKQGDDVSEGTTGNDFRVGQRVIYKTSQGQEFPSIVTAVDFDEDAVKIKSANNKPFPNSGGDIEIVVDPGWKFLTVEPRLDPDSIIAVSPNMRKTTERIRDPEDWDEGNTEPPNNFAVYINGKKWKVFQGRGQFADDYKEMQHFRQLQNWALAKSQATGKKWEVYKTGEAPTA
jgi:hypothetical protein